MIYIKGRLSEEKYMLLRAFMQGVDKAFNGGKEKEKLLAHARDAAVSNDELLNRLTAYVYRFGINETSMEARALLVSLISIRPSFRHII